jgi:hypothetical protein
MGKLEGKTTLINSKRHLDPGKRHGRFDAYRDNRCV